MQAKIYRANDHDIDPSSIDSDALVVIERLRTAGHEAYLVGGSVRDLLTGRTPKDFDISTSATPEEIKAVFRRQCLLIGRRFRLAHVRFGRKVFEVSTFRTGEEQSELVLRDNTWGTPEQDAVRRDFTINGLFYDPAAHHIIDYIGGWADIHRETLSVIGDPDARFRQDPVRMLRALKFQARFNFNFDEKLEQALHTHRDEIIKSSPARLLEETLRMLESGASAPFFQRLLQYGFIEILFPTLAHFLKGEKGKELFRYLEIADQMQRNEEYPSLSRAVLTSCLLYPILQEEVKKQFLDQDKIPHLGDIALLTSSLIEAVVSSSFFHLPRRISGAMQVILSCQYRFTPITTKRSYRPKLLKDRDLPQALQFFKLRTLLDPSLKESYNNWKELHKNIQHPPRKRHPSPRSRRRTRT